MNKYAYARVLSFDVMVVVLCVAMIASFVISWQYIVAKEYHQRSVNVIEQKKVESGLVAEPLLITFDDLHRYEADSIEEILKLIISGDIDITPLVVAYDSLHGFHSGVTITISGDGSLTRESIRVKMDPAVDQIDKREVISLIELLVEEKAWRQLTPERLAVPDETKVSLSLSYRGHQSKVWEWHNDVAVNERISIIKDYMRFISTTKISYFEVQL